ncbi:MAG: GerMN domain-containing protein [Clostridiales bacterium]|nr:GerMN domain-containing protein [Clostridiales bacterium]
MKRKKLIFILLGAALAAAAIITVILLFSHAEKDFTISLYFKNQTGNSLDFEGRIIEPADKSSNEEVLTEVLKELKNGPKVNSVLQSTMGDVVIQGFKLDEENKTVYIDLSAEFVQMTPADALFLKASLVYTLTALGFIDNVYISVNGSAVTAEGEPLNRRNVLLNPDIAAEKVNYQSVTLYFTDKNAQTLIGETRLIEIKQSQSIEYQIVEQLLAGPENSDLVSAVPSGTKLINTNTENDICYVNLSSNFINKPAASPVSLLQIYSIVNTLTSLDNVNSVQLYVEGQKVSEVIDGVDISKELERNERLIAK